MCMEIKGEVPLADYMIFASGRSVKNIRAIGEYIALELKHELCQPWWWSALPVQVSCKIFILETLQALSRLLSKRFSISQPAGFNAFVYRQSALTGRRKGCCSFFDGCFWCERLIRGHFMGR